MNKWIVAQDGSMYPANRLVTMYTKTQQEPVVPIRYVENSYGDICVYSQDYATIYAVVTGLDMPVKLWHGVDDKDKVDAIRYQILHFLAGDDGRTVYNLEGR